MRWIDIILPEPGIRQEMDDLLSQAVAQMAHIPEIQTREGLDSAAMVEVFATVGQLLFQAIQSVDAEAFSPERKAEGAENPPLNDPTHDNLRGYHIVADTDILDLPWHWLHNGLEFLLDKHPICTGLTRATLPDEAAQRPWMQRWLRAGFLVGDDGTNDLKAIINQLRPATAAQPHMLFVPGHTDRQLRRLIYREAEAIQGALEVGCHGEILARMDIQPDPITPSDLCHRGLMYQALHFAGPTSQPATLNDAKGEYWMNQLIEDTAAPEKDEIESQFGLEGEVLGVDPITSLLDDVTAKYNLNTNTVEANVSADSSGTANSASANSSSTSIPAAPPATPPTSQNTWLLDDGPVDPEHLGRGGLLPPLIFSNSFCALPELGQRFTGAGASAFIGPVVPLFSRPARIFAGYFYQALGEGWSAGAAVWKAAQDCRREFGPEHPVWLSYGVQGYGTLALPYL